MTRSPHGSRLGLDLCFLPARLWWRYPHGYPHSIPVWEQEPSRGRDQPRHSTGEGRLGAAAGHLTYDGRGTSLTSPSLLPSSHSLLEDLGSVNSEQQMEMQRLRPVRSWYLARKCAWCRPAQLSAEIVWKCDTKWFIPRPAQLHMQQSQVHTAGAECRGGPA